MAGPVPAAMPKTPRLHLLLLLLLLPALVALLFILLCPSRDTGLSEPNSQVRRLPQAIVIGARKCGTRALLDFLDVHPRVRAAKEEVHFFDRPDRHSLGLEWYRDRMPLSRLGDVTVEKSPAYFVTESAPRLVRAMNPKVKLILILRDPVVRVVSDYAQHVHRRVTQGLSPKRLESIVLKGKVGRGVNQRAKMVDTSVYHRHVRRWLDHFPLSQIHLVDGDRLVREPHLELQLVENFLGLPRHISQSHFEFNRTKGFYCLAPAAEQKSRPPESGSQRCLGPEKGRKHPDVAEETLKKLRNFYDIQDKKLLDLTGKKFEWMLED